MLKVLLLVFSVTLLASVNPSMADNSLPETVLHEEARFLMGTMARIQVAASTTERAALCAAAGYRALDLADSIFSTWRPDSEITFINDHAGLGVVKISDAMAKVLSAALQVSTASNGAFDPTVLPLVELWRFRQPEPGPPPSDSAIRKTLNAIGTHHVIYQANDQTIEFTHPKTRLDFGGIAKGAALDRAADAMMKAGAVGGIIDLGGGLLVFGQGQDHLIGVVNPLDSTQPLDVIPLSNGSVATSGQYERFRVHEEKTWGHILDPRSGKPCDQALSVTVITESALLADALATACFVLGPEDGLFLLECTPGCEGLIVFESEDGMMQRLSTSGLPSIN